MKRIIIIAAVFLTTLYSCDKDDELIVYDGDQSLVRFVNSGEELQIFEDATGELEIPVGVSALSDQDRTFNFTIDEDLTTADPDSYEFESTTVTIPANEYVGFITLTGEDANLSPEPEGISIVLEEGEDYLLDSNSRRIGIVVQLVCPVPEDYFVGDYQLVNTVQAIGAGFGTVNVEEGVYTVGIGSTPTERTFSGVRILPAFTEFRDDVVINLSCNRVILSGRIEFSAGSTIFHAAEGQIAPYDLDDDDVIVVNYVENVLSTNGFPAQPAQFELRKI